jgi:hypothetical protein
MLNVHIWYLISVACQWKWQTTSSPKSAQERTKKHPPHSPQQISRIILSVLRVDKSNVKNYRRQHESPHLSTTPTQYWHRTEHLISPGGSQTRSNVSREGFAELQDRPNRVWLELAPDRCHPVSSTIVLVHIPMCLGTDSMVLSPKVKVLKHIHKVKAH